MDQLRQQVTDAFAGRPDEWFKRKPTRIPALADLSDNEVHALLSVVIHEGDERGFGEYWYE